MVVPGFLEGRKVNGQEYTTEVKAQIKEYQRLANIVEKNRRYFRAFIFPYPFLVLPKEECFEIIVFRYRKDLGSFMRGNTA